mmetsp:Transcript_10254/g.14810  ORF Transcript_10254/g.14810 Transcript_10254/m.14810 type:complete len:131 (-) Transcript_10254:2795-3187(-)
MVAQIRYLFLLLVALCISFVSTTENPASVPPAPSIPIADIKKRTKAQGIRALVVDVFESWTIDPTTSKLTSQPTSTPIPFSSQTTANRGLSNKIETNFKIQFENTSSTSKTTSIGLGLFLAFFAGILNGS